MKHPVSRAITAPYIKDMFREVQTKREASSAVLAVPGLLIWTRRLFSQIRCFVVIWETWLLSFLLTLSATS